MDKHDPRAREYINPQQIAWPTGGYLRAGSSLWLTPEEYALLDHGIQSVLVDRTEFERRELLRTGQTDEVARVSEAASLEASGKARPAVEARRTLALKHVREYADRMCKAYEAK